jgi:thiol-disulfide isomerase/thioredoxin
MTTNRSFRWPQGVASVFLMCVLLGQGGAYAESVKSGQLGCDAPTLAGLQWIKGEAVRMQKDSVYVVEFWATWCGPCIKGMPHLTELQHAYREKGVTVIGISKESADTVRPFVAKRGTEMDYTVAVDSNGQVYEAYMKAFAQNSIPHAFIVDRAGIIAWRGHPMNMDTSLAQIVSGTFNAAQFARQLESENEQKTRTRLVFANKREAQEKKVAEFSAAIEKEPANVALHVARAEAYLGDSFSTELSYSPANLVKAQQDFKKALELDPQDPHKVAEHISFIDAWQTRGPQRIDRLKAFVDMYPSSIRLPFVMYSLYYDAKQTGDAWQALDYLTVALNAKVGGRFDDILTRLKAELERALQGATYDADSLQADMAFFTDPSCRQLKPDLQAPDLARFKSNVLKTVAAGLLNGSYDTTYRAAAYEAYPSPRALGRTLKLGDGFSRYENITGICLPRGTHVVLVGETEGKELSLLIPKWMRKPAPDIKPTKDPNGWGLHKQRIALVEGVNLINVKKGGNVYVSYFDDHAEQAPQIPVHFPTGQVNGFFDLTKHTNADWDRLLDWAVSPIMDARGKHIQVAYPVEWFKVYTRSQGVQLINNYDTLLRHHYTVMGLVKYDKVPKNRILARVNFNYYMFRDGDGVAYLGNKGTMRMVADPAVVISGDPCWGFSHETGHVLQMRPQMTWGGMTEVSCNIFSMYTVTGMGNKSRLAAQKNYASARKNIIEATPKISFLHCKNVFDRLVPFWQLHLYFSRNGRPDFYADVMEAMRNRPDAGRGNDSILNQFEFVTICCDVAKLDLTDFFEAWGFFYVGEIAVKDYGSYEYTITQQMVDETKSSIANQAYKKPNEDITLIED